jgi:hypothetical protein
LIRPAADFLEQTIYGRGVSGMAEPERRCPSRERTDPFEGAAAVVTVV